MHQARLINRRTYVTQALKTIPTLPEYSELTKNERRPFAHVHSLVENVLQIAAGSTSTEVQLKLLEDRWLLTQKAAFKKNLPGNPLNQPLKAC